LVPRGAAWNFDSLGRSGANFSQPFAVAVGSKWEIPQFLEVFGVFGVFGAGLRFHAGDCSRAGEMRANPFFRFLYWKFRRPSLLLICHLSEYAAVNFVPQADAL